MTRFDRTVTAVLLAGAAISAAGFAVRHWLNRYIDRFEIRIEQQAGDET